MSLLEKTSPDCRIISVPGITQGAACTTLLAVDEIDPEQPLLIANSDQWVDLDIHSFLSRAEAWDGCILIFQHTDPKWSYVKVNEVGEVIEVAEKKVISSNATVGLYAFRKAKDYIQAAEQMIQENERANGEFYVCPVYQKLIQQGKRIGIFEIQSTAMHGLGTPGDLEVFIKNHSSPSSSTKPEALI
jgi:dTDP-glucose pyrophosphorylase